MHGSHELHRLGHRIFVHLVEHEGFTVFAYEFDQVHAALLDEYVQGTRSDLDAIMAQRWWASASFYDEALIDLLQWMRQYNATATERVRFAGYDSKQPELAMFALSAALREVSVEAALEAENLFKAVRDLGGLGVIPNFAGYSGVASVVVAPRTAESQVLRVRLRVRTSGLTWGTVGLTVQADTLPAQTAALEGGNPDARAAVGESDGRDAWSPLEVSLELPAEVTEVSLTVFHRGDGTAWFDGLEIALADEPIPTPDLAEFERRPLLIPLLQVDDYVTAPDGAVTFDGHSSLRVTCDPRLDMALAAARRIQSIVAQHVERNAELGPAKAGWLRQMARSVVQAAEWRTAEQSNRDVFLAENLTWLAREAFPRARILALAHSSHSQRLPRRMGAYMAETHGEAYRTVSMFPLEGERREFGALASLSASSLLEALPLEGGGPWELARYGAGLASGDLVFAPRELAAARGGSNPAGIDAATAPEVAILVRRVTAVRPMTVALPTVPGHSPMGP